MDRHSDWATIIALIGNGQEIHRGEAGLAEWGRALARFPEWKVCAPPLVRQKDVLPTFRLFEPSAIKPKSIWVLNTLHLNISTRSIRAQRISDWVDAILSGRQDDAVAIAKRWAPSQQSREVSPAPGVGLDANRRGRTRAGLVASARAARLRADGLELQLDQR